MKYLGGKYFLAKHIAEVLLQLPLEYTNGYLEPFCGALSVLTRMAPHFDKCEASDVHEDLIELWKQVKTNTFRPPKTMTEARYLRVKKMKSPSALKAFVGFGCSFGGKYFAAYAQKYTGGKRENYLQAATNSVHKIHPLIQNCTFRCVSYDQLKPVNKLVYCDPPYMFNNFPVKYRNSTKKYDVFDSELFWTTMRQWSQNNLVVISEVKAPADFVCIWQKEKYRSVSQSKKTRFKDPHTKKFSTEKLFMHRSYFDTTNKTSLSGRSMPLPTNVLR